MPKAPVKKQPTWKIYTVISVIVLSVFLATGLLALWAQYPTETHRELAKNQQELANNKGGWLNAAVYDSKSFKSLADRDEAKQTKTVRSIYDVVQLLLYVTVVVLVYRFIRRKKLSASTRATILATVVTVAVGNFVATMMLSLVEFSISGYEFDFGPGVWQLYTLGFLMSLVFTFAITWLVALIYDKKIAK